ncbi:MAG: hypothetical protein VX669_16635 [Planctomycetota bacterium]|nr:hypothetical protein [Planctomycetota bacterium]
MPSQQHDHDVSNPSPVPANDPDSTTPSVPAARTHRTWWIAGGAVVLALVGIQMLVTQPLARQLAGVRRNLIRVEKDMADLVGARDAIWETSDLLAGIQDQSDRLDATRTSIETIRDFREQVENAAAGLDETRGVVVQLSALQDRIVDASADHQAAMTALNRLVQLRDVAVTGVERTDRAVTEVTRLQGVADDLDQAHDKVEQLVELRDAILRGGQDTDEARATLDQLVLLQDSLNTHASDVAVADKNLSTLLALGESLRTRSNDIASAVESVEVLADLQRDIHEHVQSLSGMRRELMEVVLLQSTVARVVRILGPLSELADLRRLSASEIRSAARSISRQRANQQAQRVIGRPANASPRTVGSDRSIPTTGQAGLFDGHHPLGLDRVVPSPAEARALHTHESSR